MARKLAVMHNGSNEIVAIVEGRNPRTAASKADEVRSIFHRNFQEVERKRADAEYDVYELDESDIKLFRDPDRLADPKYTTYVRANCPHVASVIVSRK